MNKVSDVSLAHDSFVSLHAQLHNQLRQLILSGRWASGTRIPSESQLTSHLNISRSTVRLALQQAEIEGLIERLPGKGTFVAHQTDKDTPSKLVGFVTCEFDSESHLLLLNGAEDAMKSRDYRVVFSNARSYEEEIFTLRRLKEEGVAGILLWPNLDYSTSQHPNISDYREINLPVIFMDRRIDGFECDYVTSDNYGGAFAMIQHLIDCGHQNIAFVSHGNTELVTVRERYRGFQDAMYGANLTPCEPWVVGQEGREMSTSEMLRASTDSKSREFQQFKHLMTDAPQPPTAIFALNDALAILAMQVMKALGINVPHEVSIAGFDDIDVAVHLEVPLTTVAQDRFSIGKHAAHLLMQRLEGDTGPARSEVIPTQLRIRSSTAVSVTAQP
jgi:DNA-binding LacI/PurR family transcriptional regulator